MSHRSFLLTGIFSCLSSSKLLFWCHSILETKLITRSCTLSIGSEQRELIVLWDILPRLLQNLEKLSCFFVKASRSRAACPPHFSNHWRMLSFALLCPHPTLVSGNNNLEIYLIRIPFILIIVVITFLFTVLHSLESAFTAVSSFDPL